MPAFRISDETPSLQPAYLRQLCLVLRRSGVDTDSLLAHAGLGSHAEVLKREAALSQRALTRVITMVQAMPDSYKIALEAGLNFQVSLHGPLGHAVIASQTLGQALEVVEAFSAIRYASLGLSPRQQGDGVQLEVTELVDLGEARTFILTIIAATLTRLCEAVIGDSLPRLRIDFPFNAPAWRSELEKKLNVEAHFDLPRMLIHLPQSLLELPGVAADALAHGDAVHACEKQLALLRGACMADRVRERLRAREDDWPDLADLAAFFSVSPRTLIRRLKQEGSSYQALLDERRRERAQWYLMHTRDTVEAIAARLGYGDTSNFSRTYRRWFGLTPSAARRRSR